MRIIVRDPSRKVSHLSMVVWIITVFTRLISPTRIRKPVLMMDIKVSKDKNSRWVDREDLIYVRWNRMKNCAQRQRRWSIEEKEVRYWVKIEIFLEFPKILSLKSFGNLWGQSYTKFVRWISGLVLLVANQTCTKGL